MWNAIPIIGWLIDLVLSMSMSVPFWYIWNKLAPTYAYWLPKVYQNIPFWHCVGIFIVVPIIKHIFVPTLVSSSSSSKD